MDPLRLYQERIVEGIGNSLLITFGAVVVGIGLGMVLAIGRASTRWWIALPTRLVVDLGRAVPLLPVMYVVYFGVLAAGIPIQPEEAGILAIGPGLACYMAEIYRAGFASVPHGPEEAGFALGMSPWRVRVRVTLPLAIIAMLPALGQRVVGTLLDSSIVSAIGAREITGVSRNIIDVYFATSLWWIVAGTYLMIAFPVSRVFAYLERRFTVTALDR